MLLERDCKELIEILINDSKKTADDGSFRPLPAVLLGNCLANEVQITPNLLDAAIEWFAKSKGEPGDTALIEVILNNKFGDTFRKGCKKYFLSKYEDQYAFQQGGVLGEIFLLDNADTPQKVLSKILTCTQSDDRENICFGALGLMSLTYREQGFEPPKFMDFDKRDALYNTLLKHLGSGDNNPIVTN